jgi:hypothetical protein
VTTTTSPIAPRDRCTHPTTFAVLPVGPRAVRVVAGPHPDAVVTISDLADSTPAELAERAAAALGTAGNGVRVEVEGFSGNPRCLMPLVGAVLRMFQIIGRPAPSAGCVTRVLRNEYPVALVGAVIEEYDRHAG